MIDLTQRLRAWAHDERLGHGPLLLDAAAEIERQRQLIEDIDASGIHSCHDRCQRLECVQRREIERLRRERDELRALLMDARGRVVLLSRVTTHYPGCAQHHPDCALIARIDAAMAWEVRDE